MMPTTEEVRSAVRVYRVHPLEFDAWLERVKGEATRAAMVELYAEAMEEGAEGALRFLASRYEERYDEPIPEPAVTGREDER